MDENRFWILAAKKLSGNLDREESNEIELLFANNPDYKKLFARLEQGLLDHKSTGVEKSAEKILNNLRLKLSVADPQQFLPKKDRSTASTASTAGKLKSFLRSNLNMLIVSSCFLLLTVAVIWKIFFNGAANVKKTTPFLGNNISTRPGSKTQVKLPDGTLVVLNSDSKLSYPDNFLGNTRDVTLEGEAFFDVAENKTKPFIIHADAMDIKVLGTVFNVKAYPNDLTSEASLIRGSIEVTLKNRKNDRIMLKPTEKITISNPNSEPEKPNATAGQDGKNFPLVSLHKVNYDKVDSLVNEIAWVQNRLVFNNESLGNIVVLLERWYGKKIEIRKLNYEELRFTGKFNNETIDQVLKALQLSHRFSYKREKDIIIIS